MVHKRNIEVHGEVPREFIENYRELLEIVDKSGNKKWIKIVRDVDLEEETGVFG